jgi:hypothetical protein
MKKLTLMAALLVLVASFAMAEDPKIGLEFVQRMDADFVDGAIVDSVISDYDAVYSRTEIKAKAGFKFGAVSLTPWVKDRLESRFNPGNLEGSDVDNDTTTAANEFLGKIRFRNRLYLGVDTSYKVMDALNIGLNLEYRVASDLRTDKTGTALPEYRFTPALVVSGEVSGFYYSVLQGVPFYFDTSIGDYDNDDDDLFMELEGTYNLGYGMKVGETKIKFDLTDDLVITFPEFDEMDDADPVTSNALNFKIHVSVGDLTPNVGFVWVMKHDGEDIIDSIMGASMGASFKKDNWSLGFNYMVGVNGAEDRDGEVESSLSTSIKFKL